MKKISILLVITILFNTLLILPSNAAMITSKESLIQSEIEQRSSELSASIRTQLIEQNALDHFDVYWNILYPEIVSSTYSKYNIRGENALNAYAVAEFGAVLSYIEPNTDCEVVVTYLDYNNSYYYVLGGQSFSCWNIISDIGTYATGLISTLQPLSYVLSIASYANSLALNQIRDADGYARVINVRDPLDNTRSSVVTGWDTYDVVEITTYMEDPDLTLLPEYNPFEHD